ncbi:MAG: SUMF1/EgtB/PvdO family nonheme iron enzyme [Gammaproteobacteria bacterium]
MKCCLRAPLRWLAGLIVITTAHAAGVAVPPTGCSQCHTSASHSLFAVKTDSNCATCHGEMKPAHTRPRLTQNQLTDEETPLPDVKVTVIPPDANPAKVTADPNPMVLIPAGKFIMGYDDRMPDEGPAHQVYLKSFWIDRYEVTNAQYTKFIDATHRRSPSHFRNRTYPPGKSNHPVTEVTWYDAVAYCKWAGKRLPTDQEWEKAARGTDGRMFPWGNEFDINKANTPQRWMALHQEGDTLPVGSFPSGASPYGVYDMSGNVWEWTSSWYKPYPGNKHPSENYGEKYKTLKGGSWWDCTFYKCGISAPVFNRSFFIRTTRNKSFGFRCAKGSAPGDGPRATHKTHNTEKM